MRSSGTLTFSVGFALVSVAASPAIGSSTYITCDFAPSGNVAAYEIDLTAKAIKDVESPDLALQVVQFTGGKIIFETDNRFYRYTFNAAKGMSSNVRVSINRVTGVAWASLVRESEDFGTDVCPKDGGWTCLESSRALAQARGICQATKLKF